MKNIEKWNKKLLNEKYLCYINKRFEFIAKGDA